MALVTDVLVAQAAAEIPKLIVAVVILAIGYVVARVVARLVRAALEKVKLNQAVSSSPAGGMVNKVTQNPSRIVADVAFWLVFLDAISLAVSMLGIAALTAFIAAIYGYLPNVLAALLILLVAGAVSAAVSTLVSRVMGETATGKLVAGITPAVVMSIAVFMALTQLQIAPAIVTITYAAILGAIALGSALAFGLGGRQVAGELLQKAYDAGREQAGQVKEDLATGKQRATSMAQQLSPDTNETPARQGQVAMPAFGESLDSFKPAEGESLDEKNPDAL